MVPRLDSADQAREAVTFLRYPPDGIRGVATRVRGAGLGVVGHPDIHRLNERVVGIIQIESVGGLRDADEIAAIDGVDVLFVGPADLSHSLGIPGQVQLGFTFVGIGADAAFVAEGARRSLTALRG
jgi:2-keto-3-deoxy-L-rhamnonate aldolase RhmA